MPSSDRLGGLAPFPVVEPPGHQRGRARSVDGDQLRLWGAWRTGRVEGHLAPTRRFRYGIDVAPGLLHVHARALEQRPDHGPDGLPRNAARDAAIGELLDGLRQAAGLGPFDELVREPEGVPEWSDQSCDWRRPGGRRKAITGWSGASRRRLLYRMATVDWDSLPGVLELVTLTYQHWNPEWDGRKVKDDLAAFRRRVERAFGPGFTMRATWKLEFQGRGVPHLHLAMTRPAMMRWREFAELLRRHWHGVAYGCAGVGECCGNAAHRQQGVRVDRSFGVRAQSVAKIAAYFTWHASKSAGGHKAYQNEVPAGFDNVGRFWGIWNAPSESVGHELDGQAFVQVRRFMHQLRRANLARQARRAEANGSTRAAGFYWSRRARLRARAGPVGMWVVFSDPARIADQLARWLHPEHGPPRPAGVPRPGFCDVAPPIPAAARRAPALV